MGYRIRKQKIGDSLPYSVKYLTDISKLNFRKDATAWCKSAAIKHKFYVSDLHVVDNRENVSSASSIIKKMLSYGATAIAINGTPVEKKYVIFKFEDQNDAALFKTFWG